MYIFRTYTIQVLSFGSFVELSSRVLVELVENSEGRGPFRKFNLEAYVTEHFNRVLPLFDKIFLMAMGFY